ncbi:MAG: hypothetical protein ACREIU_12325, partial [Planctomycetota bacterium]
MGNHRAERGSILIFLVASVSLLAGALLGLITVEQGRASRARTEVERTRAFGLAESGIDQAAVLMSSNAWGAATTLDWSSDGADNDGDGLVDEGDESLTATVDRWWADGFDNDGDGEVDEKDEGVARVACTVPLGISTVTLTGWLRQEESILPLNIPAVLTLLDPNADLTFNGNSFQVNGNDNNLDMTPGPGSPVYGIAIDGTQRDVLTQFSGQQLDNLVGAGGWPSVTTWAPPSSTWLADKIAALRPFARVNFTNYSRTFTGDLGDWRTGDVFVTHSEGTLRIGGGGTGAGVLLVDGDLELSGDWNYAGYVFVTGRVRVVGGGGRQTLSGAMFVGADVQQALSGGLLSTLLAGNINLIYSTAALN